MKKIRAAIVGLGSMGSNHFRVLSSIPDVEIVALCDLDIDRVPRGRWRVTNDYREVAKIRPDLCVVATPTNSHLEITLHLIEMGIPILVEKPLAATADEVEQICIAKQRMSGSVAVGMIERFNEAVIAVKEMLLQGAIGKIQRIATNRVGPNRLAEEGALLDLGIHDLDLVHWLTGDLIRKSDAQFVVRNEIDIVASVSGRTVSGIIFEVVVSSISPKKRRRIEILGDAGELEVELIGGRISKNRFDEKTLEWGLSRELHGVTSSLETSLTAKVNEPLLLEHREVIAAIRKKDWSALPSVDEAFRLGQIIDSLYGRIK